MFAVSSVFGVAFVGLCNTFLEFYHRFIIFVLKEFLKRICYEKD